MNVDYIRSLGDKMIPGIHTDVDGGYISIPVTIDGSGGRTSRGRMQFVLTVVILIVCLLIFIKAKGFGWNARGILLRLFAILVFIFAERFLVFRERYIKRQYTEIDDKDYVVSAEKLWGIYSQSELFPQIYYTRSGRMVSFLLMSKDVTVGKVVADKTSHFDAISDAYNVAGTNGISVTHIDMMDFVGNDDRLDTWYHDIVSTDSQEFKDIFSLMYTHLRNSLRFYLTTYDIYCFSSSGSENHFMYWLDNVASTLMNANYTSYKYASREDLQSIFKNIFNISDFSYIDATSNVFSGDTDVKVTPILLRRGAEVQKLNKTQEERIADKKNRELEAKNKKKKDKKPKSSAKEEEVSLF